MAGRPFWAGHLRLSLVTCAVSMIPARTEAERIRFHMMNRQTGNRVFVQYVDAVTSTPVDDGDLVKGYPCGDDQYVVLEDDELDAIALESTRTIDIECFVDREAIGWVWYDTPHYLLPDDEIGTEAFTVIRDAMRHTGTVGIARLVLYRREHAVLLEPRDNGIVVWTLRYGVDMRDPADSLPAGDIPAPNRQDVAQLGKVIAGLTRPWNAAMVHDPVQARLKGIIDARRRSRRSRPVRRSEPPAEEKIVNIMDTLRASLKSSDRNGS